MPRGVRARSDALCAAPSTSTSRSCPHCACAVAQCCHSTGGVQPKNCDCRLPRRFIAIIGRSFAHMSHLYRVNGDPDTGCVVYHRHTSGPESVSRRRRDEPTRSCPHPCGSCTGSLAGVSAPAEHVAIGFTGWRCQASPLTQDDSPTSRKRSFHLFLTVFLTYLMRSTNAQSAV